jgi:hypothetical protein
MLFVDDWKCSVGKLRHKNKQNVFIQNILRENFLKKVLECGVMVWVAWLV